MAVVVLANSGGLDSALLAASLDSSGHTVHSIFIDAGVLNSAVSAIAAEETASRFCDSHYTVKVDFGYTPNYWKIDGSVYPYDVVADTKAKLDASPIKVGGAVEEVVGATLGVVNETSSLVSIYEATDISQDLSTKGLSVESLDSGTFSTEFHCMPHLSMIVHSIALSYSRMVKAEFVYSGFKGVVGSGYVDSFNVLLENNTRLGDDSALMVFPLLGVDVHYSSIAKNLGQDIGKFDYTHSCNWGTPCGSCWKCIDRTISGLSR
jgi:7-cyano-7-deazaguanine synthase in queuosine biosynthesis